MQRADLLHQIDRAFRVNPVLALLGPRQCGKTTIAKRYSQQKEHLHYFDCENPFDLARLDAPMLALQDLTGLIIIDEIQRRPDLFPVLRVLVDAKKRGRKFLILGSASRDLIKQSSESLAGRVSYLEITPFNFTETHDLKKLWFRGGFPRSYLSRNVSDSNAWRNAYITTFLEQDIPNLGITIPAQTLRRFWLMLSHYHGNIFNASELGRSLGVAHTTIRHYIDILTGTFMVRQLQPWFENINKRQVKAPKIYFRDSGIFHTLCGIESEAQLQHYPKLGASWEGFILEEVLRKHQATTEEAYFWAVHQQAELDLLLIKGGKKLGFEIKYTDRPQLSASMLKAYEYLKLDKLILLYPGPNQFPLSNNILAIPAKQYLESNIL